MKFNKTAADFFIPDGCAMPDALARTTHLCVGAHQDDQEFMAGHGILECFGRGDRWFTGVTVTHGAGSARTGLYAATTDEGMMAIRRNEQRKAAVVGEYAAEIQLAYSSADVRLASRPAVVADLFRIFDAARPETVYLHNPADKHDTHVAVFLQSLAALRKLPDAARPKAVYGCEIWRSLDWLCDSEKIVLPVSVHANITAALSGVFDSQIAGGKRYDLAVAGRRMANATFFESHEADTETALSWAMDLTPLVYEVGLDPVAYTLGFIDRLREDVQKRLERLGKAEA